MIDRVIDSIVEKLLAMLMAATILTVFTGVIFRYVLVSPLAWTEEIARLCLVWITFLGAYLAMRRDSHMYLKVFYDRFSPETRYRVDIIGNLVLIVFYLLLIVYGSRYGARFMGMRSSFLELPLGISYIALPAGAGLLLIATLTRIGRLIADRSARGGVDRR